jgi:hypothetical protein
MELPYRVTTFEPPRRVVLHAETRWMELRDEITVESADGGSAVTYDARIQLRGALRVLDPILSRLFSRTGERAAAGLATVTSGHVVAG